MPEILAQEKLAHVKLAVVQFPAEQHYSVSGGRMMQEHTSSESPIADRAGFYSTRWSLVLTAQASDAAVARQALETLCQIYWEPIYGFIRRQGHSAATAEDLTQGFLLLLVERDDLARVTPERGRFRAFLLTALKNFLINEHQKQTALKRGGTRRLFSLDCSQREARSVPEPADHLTADQSFEREWACTLLSQVRQRLRLESQAAGRADLFLRLEPLLTGGELEDTYLSIAQDLQQSVGAIKTAVHRLRRRFGELVREEIAQTVSSPSEIDDEIRELFRAFESSGQSNRNRA